MKWSNVKLIFLREARDQLRDRRMIFMIAVLPLVLYPLLGLNWIQVSQFMQEKPSDVLLLGVEALPEFPPLLEGDAFVESVCPPADARRLKIQVAPSRSAPLTEAEARAEIRKSKHHAIVVFPADFNDKLARFQADLANATREGMEPAGLTVPEPEIYYDTALDHSQVARARVNDVLSRWRDEVVRDTLRQTRVSETVTQPFEVASSDVAEAATRRAAQWSKLLPFVVVIWALTGAFYPAVDLCAGEKERGTLETLLSSPAERSEIVWGKLLTVMSFSMITSLLNLISMGMTGLFVLAKMQGPGEVMEAPPISALFWLVLGLVPVAALFSALALAIAAFARSSKEGQYYLMPLLLITLPLMMLPMTAELDLGTALIPISGLMLLMRKLIEGEYATALTFLPPIAAVTGACCLLAIRWAVDQFHKESVLFRESERWGLGLWLRHVMRERRATPSIGEALLCGTLLLIIRFFASFSAGSPGSWPGFVSMMMISQIALILTPVLLMTIILTRDPLRTLGLRAPNRWLAIPAAVLLAIAVHPASVWLSIGIKHLYPLNPAALEQLTPISAAIMQAPLWQVLLVIALIPAVCEELAFRGFVLSGLRHMGHKWTAIAVTALLFGVTHGILQQSLAAAIVGLVIGYVTVQSGSVIPAILFHATHNSLAVLFSQLAVAAESGAVSRWTWMLKATDGEFSYQWSILTFGLLAAAVLLTWFRRLPYDRYCEESLQERLDHQNSAPQGILAPK